MLYRKEVSRREVNEAERQGFAPCRAGVLIREGRKGSRKGGEG